MAKVKVFRDDVFVKYVKKARMWCRTHWDKDGIQKQEWFSEKPEAIIEKET